MGLFTRRKTVFVDSDILVIGGGMGGCVATYESRYWGPRQSQRKFQARTLHARGQNDS